jgi:hypothetical protein
MELLVNRTDFRDDAELEPIAVTVLWQDPTPKRIVCQAWDGRLEQDFKSEEEIECFDG